MVERTRYFAVHAVTPFVTAFNDKKIDLEERWDLTWMNVFYTEMFKKMTYDHSGRALVRNELVRLRFKLRSSKIVAEKSFTAYCSPRLFTLKCFLLTSPVDDLERPGGLSIMEGGLIDQFNVLIKKSFTMTF